MQVLFSPSQPYLSSHRLLGRRWEVTYTDGDCGEKEWHELKDTLAKWPPAGL